MRKEEKLYIAIGILLLAIGLLIGIIITNNQNNNKKEENKTLNNDLKTVDDYIQNSVINSFEASAKSEILGYIDAIEKQIMINELNSNESDNIESGEYTVAQLTNIGVSVKGTIPSNSSIIKIDNDGSVSKESIFITNNQKYKVFYKDGSWTVENNN